MKFLDFSKEPVKPSKLEPAKDEKDEDKENPEKDADWLFKTDNPVDTVQSTTSPLPYGLGTRYVEPGHGLALVDVLRRVASSVRKIANPFLKNVDENLWKEALDIISKAFKSYNMNLVQFHEQGSHNDVPYYVKETKNGIHFWVNERNNTNLALTEALKALKENGILAIKREHGILLSFIPKMETTYNPAEVARHSKGLHVNTENTKKDCWHTIDMEGFTLKYCYDSKLGKLTIHCKGGFIPTTEVYQLNDATSRKISKILKYQAKRYSKLADPATYNLTQAGKPFRLKKHGLIYCGEGKTLVITPQDEAYLVTDKGEYKLCREEGKIGLNPALTFNKIKNHKNLKYTFGDIWVKFGHLLAKRGLFV